MADDPRAERPEFGPHGYLPERAAKRARKIVLRAPLGVPWIVASILAGVVVVAAGVLLLVRGDRAPAAPYVAVGPVEELAGQVRYDPDLDVLLVGLGGRIRAFDAAPDVDYCEASRRLETPDGGVWALTGRSLTDRPSFAEHPAVVVSGTVYVDPTAATTPPAPSPDQVSAACH